MGGVGRIRWGWHPSSAFLFIDEDVVMLRPSTNHLFRGTASWKLRYIFQVIFIFGSRKNISVVVPFSSKFATTDAVGFKTLLGE